MHEPFEFDGTTLNLFLGDNKSVTIKKVTKQGFIRSPFNSSKKINTFAKNNESIYEVEIKTTKSDFGPLDQIVTFISKEIGDEKLCPILEKINDKFKNVDKPHHFTRFKGKKDEVCSRKNKKDKFKKFTINGEKFLVIRGKYSENDNYYFKFFKFDRLYSEQLTQTNNSGKYYSLYHSLGVKGKWVHLFDTYEITYDKKAFVNKNTYAITDYKNYIKDKFKEKTGIELNDGQLDKIMELLSQINDVTFSFEEIFKKKDESAIKETNNKNYIKLNGI